MRPLVISMFMTLDGVMQAPGGPEEDTEGGFPYGGWQGRHFDEEAGHIVDEQMATVDAVLLGRKTYEIFAAYWPHAPQEDPVARTLNSVPKYVWSNTLQRVEWHNSHLIRGDLVEEVTRLKEQPGKGVLSITGSSKLAQSLMRHGLVDEYSLWFHPVVLGTGKRLFEDVPRMEMELVDMRRTPTGIVILRYRPAAAAQRRQGEGGVS